MTKERKTLYENIQALRLKPPTARVGDHYKLDEDNDILAEAANGTPFNDIAKKYKRTTRAIRTRVVMYAVQMMQSHDLTVEQVSYFYNLKPFLVARYYQRVCKEKQKVQQTIRDACFGYVATQ